VTRKQIEVVITEVNKLRNSHPHLSGVIELLERYIRDFDRLAAAQRIVPVDRVVEKEKLKPILVPTRDSASIRDELAQSLLIEKLVL
jgi:hypothetical protein